MKISLAWLNQFLDPADLSAAEADALLTAAGFPIEEERTLANGDVYFDVEITSNRGDCLSHISLAREVAASTQASKRRTLVVPDWPELDPGPIPITELLTLDNRDTVGCPRFTAQVIRGVQVAPSPMWLCDLLEAVGQRPINNLVDVTNWLTLAFGQPAHVFDLACLAGPGLVVRSAIQGEQLTTLDGKDRTLNAGELVVADVERAQSIAGVIGGAPSQVTDQTVDVVLEVACWNPVTIRAAARHHNLHTDASHRFERGVDPRTMDLPALIGAQMILQLAGGTRAAGMLDEGAPPRPETVVAMRPSRAQHLIGVEIPTAAMIAQLRDLAIGVEQQSDDELACTIPPWRLDLTREVDLIEEVARTTSFDEIPLTERVSVAIAPPQPTERARRELGAILTGLGFFETVTFSFIDPATASRWLAPGLSLVEVDDDRRKAEPTLRPSVIPSLLACRTKNQDARVEVAGGVRLVERSAVFAQHADGSSAERRTLSLIADAPNEGRSLDDRQLALRQMRGTIEALARAMAGPTSRIEVRPADPAVRCWDPAACAHLQLHHEGHITELGVMGLIAKAEQAAHDLAIPIVAAELDADALEGLYPPAAHAQPLPMFPGIERDLSIIVDETVRWDQIDQTIRTTHPDRLESVSFVGIYRGKQVGAGRKSVTLRMGFRDPDRTLRHEEVDPQVETVVDTLSSALGATLRT